MVSTRSRVVEVREPDPSTDLVAIIEAQAKCNRNLLTTRRENIEEMKALREENARLKKRVEIAKGKVLTCVS